MIKTALSISLFVSLTLPALAASDPREGRVSKPNALPVSELLERTAKSPLGPAEAGLLRAVADLVDKEQAAGARGSRTADSDSDIAPLPAPVAVRAMRSTPAPVASPRDQRKRLVFRLRNAPVIDVAKALEEFLESEKKVRRACEKVPKSNCAVFVPEPLSNSLLISGTPEVVDSLTELIAELDAERDLVMVDVCIAELLPPSRDGRADDGMSDDSAKEEAPHMEKDWAAWLAWAKNHGRLDVLGRPQIMTLDNQPAFIEVRRTAPAVEPKLGTDASAKGNQIERTEVWLSVNLTPRISPEGLVVMELDVEHARDVTEHRAAGPIIGKTSAQTTISAKDGQTVVLAGLMRRAEDGQGSLIIAVTPRINPKR